MLTTVRDLLNTMPHLATTIFDPEVEALDLESGCGNECAKVIRTGHELLEVAPDLRGRIAYFISHQCTIFFRG